MTEMINTLQQLAAFGFDTSNILLADGSRLEILAVVRTIPGRRLVCRGVWQSQHVYAKFFLGKNSARYADRDTRGVAWLSQAGIATPALLCANETADAQAKVLIFNEILEAKNAEQRLAVLDHAQKTDLAGLLVQEVAAHHRSGLIQTDMYLKNFLINANKVYTLDGDGIRQLSGFCQRRKKLVNLATLLSKFDALDDGWTQELYAQYCEYAGVTNSSSEGVMLGHLVQKIRQTTASAYADKKVFRNCTDVKVMHTFDSFKAIAADFSFENAEVSMLDACLENPELNIKNGNTCTVGLAGLGGRQVVVKRYNIKNFWHGLNRALRMSRAARSWANAHRLIISNIATPKPLVLLEDRFGWLRRRAYYLSEYVDAPDALQFFAQCSDTNERQAVACQLAALLHKLYLLKYTHGDFKATNIKINDAKPLLIDLDAMRAYSSCYLGRCCFERGHVKDLKRFIRNWDGDQETQKLIKRALVAEYASGGSNTLTAVLIRAGIV